MNNRQQCIFGIDLGTTYSCISYIDEYGDEAVAKGAALYGQKLLLDQDRISKVNKKSFRQKADAIMPGDASTSDAGKQASIDVTREHTLKEGVLKKLDSISITNVTSHSFGILAMTDYNTPRSREIIENLMLVNDPLPTFRVQTFGTLEDDQAAVELRIMENTEKTSIVEPGHYKQEAEIGKVILPLPSGLPANSPIEVTFELDQQGRLHVIGCDPRSKTTVEATFETRGGLSDQELQAVKSRVLHITIV